MLPNCGKILRARCYRGPCESGGCSRWSNDPLDGNNARDNHKRMDNPQPRPVKERVMPLEATIATRLAVEHRSTGKVQRLDGSGVVWGRVHVRRAFTRLL